MDPNATLGLILDACHDNDRAALMEAVESLYGWLKIGGFVPSDPRLIIGAEAAEAAAAHLRVSGEALLSQALAYEEAAQRSRKNHTRPTG